MTKNENIIRIELPYKPTYFFPVVMLIFSIVAIGFVAYGIKEIIISKNILFAIFFSLFAFAVFKNVFGIWGVIGSETILIDSDILFLQSAFLGIKIKKRLSRLSRIKSMEIINLNDKLFGNSYGMLGYSDYKLQLKIGRRKKILLGKWADRDDLYNLQETIKKYI